MFIYIRLRFSQWKFGGAALLGVLHDVLIVLAFYSIFNITINNPFIAGILTVVGYSINDTIVVFDRIRENIKFMRKGNTEELVDRSITQTLGRSLMTSATTLIVMVPLLIMAGDAIREFVLPLMVGIIAGAYSSIGICSPLYYDFSGHGKLSDYEKHVKANKKKQAKEAKKAALVQDTEKAEKADAVKADDAEPAAAEDTSVKTAASEAAGEAPAQKQTAPKKNGNPAANQKRSKRYVKGNNKK